MPTHERYLKDRAYYHAYDTSDSRKTYQRALKKKKRDEGRCPSCGHQLVEGAHAKVVCTNCSERAAESKRISRNFF